MQWLCRDEEVVVDERWKRLGHAHRERPRRGRRTEVVDAIAIYATTGHGPQSSDQRSQPPPQPDRAQRFSNAVLERLRLRNRRSQSVRHTSNANITCF